METANALGCDLAAEVAGKFGRVCIRAWGASMVPAIRPGDLVFVERATTAEISVGEVIAFARAGRLIVHRVAATGCSPQEPWLVTRGDRMRQDDAPISASQLIGKVNRIERGRARLSVAPRIGRKQRALCSLLRLSDCATYLYLRLTA